jgi:NAD(P)H-flavin reductase
MRLSSGSLYFSQGGRMSQFLERMKLGDKIDVKGPLGHFVYLGRGQYRNSGRPGEVTLMSMIAGGTGITPMFQIIKVRPAFQAEEP